MHRTAVARALARLLPAPILAVALLAGLAPTAALGLDSQPSLALTATYNVDAEINYTRGTIRVVSVASVSNTTNRSFDSLTFNAAAFRLGNVNVTDVSINGDAARWALDDQTMGVTLSRALDPGESVDVRIAYGATFRTTATDKNWLFAKLRGTLHGYRWIPWLSRELRFNRPNVGEPFVTAVSPRVRVTFSSDRPLSFVTSGNQVEASGNSRSFVAHDVRDFNFVARPSFKTLNGRAAGVRVIVSYNTLNGSTMLAWAKRAVETYTRLIGPYPYGRLRIAESGGGHAMESPAMVWIPRGSSSLAWLVAHEVGHQWFYAVVGNNQALEPFADESLVTLLTREATGRYIGTDCRLKPLDRSIYEYKTCYYGVIYVQGGDYLAAYRRRVGAKAFWEGVSNYYRSYRFGFGGTRELLDALDAASSGLGGGHQRRFPSLYAVE
jgi:hypothetical protein